MSTSAASPLPAPARASVFSVSRVWTLARHTMTQLLRMRILWFLAVFIVLVVLLAFVFPKQSPEQQLLQIKNWSLGAMHAASILFVIASTALLLPRDLEDRTLYTILSKPVPRYEYLLGKLFGVLLLIGGALLFMDLVVSAVVWFKQSMLTSAYVADLEQSQSATPENVAFMRDLISRYGLNWGVHAQVWMIFLEASVITALTLLISTFASTTLFTIVTACGFTVAGFGVQLIRDWFLRGGHSPTERILGNLLSVVCPNLSLFDLSEAAARSLPVGLDVMLGLTGTAALYVAAYTAVAYLFFMDKEL